MSQAYSLECESEKVVGQYLPLYAKLFSVKYYKNFKIVESGTDKFIIGDKDKIKCKTELFIISDKSERFVATSTTHLPFLKNFGLEKTLVGFPGVRYIYNPDLKKQSIKDIHFQLNPEELKSLNADIVMAYAANLISEKRIKDLRKLGIPIVLNRDFEEKHPLARAEWMVFSSLFFSKDKEARELFLSIAGQYNNIKTVVMRDMGIRPKVLVGEIQNGKWATCGGESDLAILITDAGGDLLYKNASAETQFISLEKFFSLKPNADIWLAQNTWTSALSKNKDSRYLKVQSKALYNNNNLINKDGFNDYWETGVARPDLLLQDLYAIFYPQKNPNHKLIWYKKL